MKRVFAKIASFTALFLALSVLFNDAALAGQYAAPVHSHGYELLPLIGVGLVINQSSLSSMYLGFKTIFENAYNSAKPQYQSICIEVPSVTSVELYAWLGAFPKMRQWVGDRYIKNLTDFTWQIANLDWETSIGIPRNSIMDDQYGVFRPVIASMGAAARIHPDEVIFALLNNGFTNKCYDGLNFFDAHTFGTNKASGGGSALSTTSFATGVAAVRAMKDSAGKPIFNGTEQLTLVVGPALEGTAKTILNADFISVASGSTQNNIWKNAANYVMSPYITSATAWFLIVDFNGLRPLIFQQRQAPVFVSKEDPMSSDHVFMKKEYLYGADSRDNAGYGLPQLAYGSVGT